MTALSKQTIEFNKIENKHIFAPEYENFVENNTIEFSAQNIAVVYGPNGTGKTSLIRAILGEKDTSIKYQFNNTEYSDGSQFFVIQDQNNRNIIQGKVEDFLLGDKIKQETELHEQIQNEYSQICKESTEILRDKYKITTTKDKIISWIDTQLEGFSSLVKDLVNRQSKGSKFGVDNYISLLEEYKTKHTQGYEEDKFYFIINDFGSKDSVIEKIEKLKLDKIICNPRVRKVEENEDALSILNKFKNRSQCIVCDTDNIDSESLIEKKTKSRDDILSKLDDQTRGLVEETNRKLQVDDPFLIKKSIFDAIETNNIELVKSLNIAIKAYKEIICSNIIADFVEIYKNSQIKDRYDKYTKLINEKIEISEEDVLFIQSIINYSMNKKLHIERGDDKNIKITLDNSEFIGRDRNTLPLSTGEQNFLSLTFEFLKAKKSQQPIVILDDPISSFDSIYKNKITYAIVKILGGKKRIILTHNTDLLRLLDGQYKNCYNLYLFNNTEGGVNGFIRLNKQESRMTIDITELLDFLRGKSFHGKHNDIDSVKDKYLFQLALIPFMRGYASFIDDTYCKQNLTNLMHGYKTEEVDISDIYNKLFGNQNFESTIISVNDILKIKIDSKTEIVDKEEYPILNRTLIHTLTYLYLRLTVEKGLIDKYGIDIDPSSPLQLGMIIDKAFPEKNANTIQKRVELTTKKTLLNEFNHFEGNMNLFQPAIDITDTMLEKEGEEIIQFLNNLD